jgi:predicted O-linked N-acetylglucosamine transferase (SPINDLY family)
MSVVRTTSDMKQHVPKPKKIAMLHTLFSQGRYLEAANLAQSLTERFPQHGFGWKALGEALQLTGRPLAALPAMQKAADLLPADTQLHCDLGFTLEKHGRLAEAEVSYRQALQLNPDLAEVQNNLGNVLRALGRSAEAEASYRRALELKPDLVEVHKNLGSFLRTLGRLTEAELSYRRALQLKPDLVDVHINLGAVLRALGRLTEAEASYRQALQLKPNFADAHNSLGVVYMALGRLAEAEASFRQALQLKPGLAEAHNNLGTVHITLGRSADAEANFRRTLQLKPAFVEAHNNLGAALRALHRFAEAESSLRRAVQLNSDVAEYHNNLGNVLLDLGQLAEAELSYQRALEIRPQFADAASNLLLSLNYRTDKSAEAVLEAHREHAARFAAPRQGEAPAYSSRPDALKSERSLRVGYISADFRQHSVAYFIAPLLREHDRAAVEVFCYSDVAKPDAVTAALQGVADHWLNTVTFSDDELTERIGADGIDILVDLAGHTAGNRLPVFARQAAPVQITWLGYPNTTGLDAMNYRLVDAVTDPPGEADRWASETLIRLEDGFLCFEAAADAPLPDAPPCLAGGAITFASFNNPAKLSSATLEVWGRLLDRVSGSRLLLKGKGFIEEATRQSLLTRFAQLGGDPQRVTLLAPTDGIADHLAVYAQVDIALDPFPYNGTTTTCEALWMGVPTVTLLGERHAGRVGASLLTQVGLTDLIAPSPDAYVDIAAGLAADRDRLSCLRQTMRERVRASPMCDAKSFARKIESTYRGVWQQYCARAAARQGEDPGHRIQA